METDPSPDQGPSSGGDEHNSHDTTRTTSEFNHVVDAYDITPRVVISTWVFAQVRSLYLSLPCFLTRCAASTELTTPLSLARHPRDPVNH